MIILWLVFIVASIAFLCLYGMLFKATLRRPEEKSKEFAAVYAGGPGKEESEEAVVNVNLTDSMFLDEKGKPLKVENYDGYIVVGNSMELAIIKSGNLLLVPKRDVFMDNTPLPGVFILRRERVLSGQAQFKLRRIWAIAYLNQSNIEDVVRGIIAHPEFQQLKKNSDFCLDEQLMLEELLGKKGRLFIYKEEHPHFSEASSEDCRVVISTTLRTESNVDDVHTKQGRHISFSIHPASLVTGRIAYVYSRETQR